MHTHQTVHCPDCLVDQAHLATQPGHLRRLWVAFLLIVGVAIAEYWVGQFSHSLALQAEAIHMTADGVAIGLALFAAWLSQKPPSDQAPFGWQRVEILAAFLNSLGLLAVGGLLAWEAIAHLHHPPSEILSQPMLMTAAMGLGLNLINVLLLHQPSQQNLNVRAAFLHMVADAVSAIGVMLAAIAVWQWQWFWIDGAIGLGVAVLIVAGAIPLLRQSVRVLLEQPPATLDVAAVRTYLHNLAGVRHITDLRIWTIASGRVMLTAKLQVAAPTGSQRDRLQRTIAAALQEEFGIQDVVLELQQDVPSLITTLPNATLMDWVDR